MKAPMSDEIRKILDKEDNSDLGKLNQALLSITTAPAGYRRKMVAIKQLLIGELMKTNMNADEVVNWIMMSWKDKKDRE